MWLLTLSLAQGKVLGAVIGGKLARVFEPPEGAGEWKVNKLLSELKKVGIVTAKKEDKVEFVVEDRSRTFTTQQEFPRKKTGENPRQGKPLSPTGPPPGGKSFCSSESRLRATSVKRESPMR